MDSAASVVPFGAGKTSRLLLREQAKHLFAPLGTRLVCPPVPGYVADMKTLTVHVAKEQLSQLIAEAHPGDAIVLTDGERRVTLEASAAENGALDLDLEED